ncbi:hypothetical protein CLAIMM_14184, partial [Cladophialophora immunda]
VYLCTVRRPAFRVEHALWLVNERTSDPLRPSPEQCSAVLHSSRRQWRSLLVPARAARGFPSSCANVSSLLPQTPSLPGRSEIEELAGDTSIYLEGFSVWAIHSPPCDFAGKSKKSALHQITIGSSRPSFCLLSDDLPSAWLGFEGCRRTGGEGNYMVAFVLGWAHVLSACLVELRRESDKDQICYTEEKAACNTSGKLGNGETGFGIPVGNADLEECRWWSAVLANGCGWRATLSRAGRDFCPSWECHLQSDDQVLRIHQIPSRDSASTSPRAPSSEQALQYLYHFAQLHDAHDQLLAAFVTALMIPGQGRMGAPIALPRPEPMRTVSGGVHSALLRVLPDHDDLPHFMAFSCVTSAAVSCMLGCLLPDLACLAVWSSCRKESSGNLTCTGLPSRVP